MIGRQLITGANNTWCPGCGNFSIEHTLKDVLSDMEKGGKDLDNLVLVSGIGCHAKIADYLNVNSFYAIHGRAVPVATGIKLANRDLTVICCVGDGDAYAEGLDHLIFAAKRNIDITVIVHNNRVYGLTTGQYTPTSPLHFQGKSTPHGAPEYPFNPLDLMLASGATYIARGYTRKPGQLKSLIEGGVQHKGFSFIDILQVCATFFPKADLYDKKTYEIPAIDKASHDEASHYIREWDYNRDAPIALGLFYEHLLPVYDEQFSSPVITPFQREEAVHDFFKSRM